MWKEKKNAKNKNKPNENPALFTLADGSMNRNLMVLPAFRAKSQSK
jgi:hypothetical protein